MKATYVSFPRAFRLLQERLGATSCEIAAWVFMGPGDGGIAAYTDAQELDDPPRFYFDYIAEPDYHRALACCWFKLDDLGRFAPVDRWIAGDELLARWADLGQIAESFIESKIRGSQLHDLHPIFGATRWTESGDYPSRQEALFTLAEVKAIEKEEGIQAANTPGTQQSEEDVSQVLEEATNPSERNKTTITSVIRNVVIDAFRVRPTDDGNRKFWDAKLSDPPRWLESARTSAGKPGVSALWDPLLVAHALLGEKHMTAKALDKVMRERFPPRFADWQNETEDVDR